MPTPGEMAAGFNFPMQAFERTQETCRCGRKWTPKPHCTYCGSMHTYGKDSATNFIVDPVAKVTYRAQGYRCRNCFREFSEASMCMAPKIQVTMREQRQLEVVQNELYQLAEKWRSEGASEHEIGRRLMEFQMGKMGRLPSVKATIAASDDDVIIGAPVPASKDPLDSLEGVGEADPLAGLPGRESENKEKP